jgi:Bifunctional DNA primase/polymerase, N-terminal
MTATPEVFAAAREHYAEGRPIIGLIGKVPIAHHWRNRRSSLQEIERQLRGPATGIGLVGGPLNNHVVALDFDSPDAEAFWRVGCESAGLDPDAYPTVLTPGKLQKDGTRTPGRHRYVSDPRGLLTNRSGGLRHLKLDIRGKGQTVLPPSPHPDGGVYQWAQLRRLPRRGRALPGLRLCGDRGR